MIFMALIFGVLGASFALLLELVFLNITHLYNYTSFVFDFSSLSLLAATALIEEGSKYLFLRQYLVRFPDSSRIFSLALLSAVVFGLGFASLESVLALSTGPISRDSLFLLGTTLLHIITSIIIVLFLRQGSKTLSQILLFPLFIAFFLHFLYNAALSFLLS